MNNVREKYEHLSKNMILFSAGLFGQKILTFLLVPLYTNYLSTEQYGIIDLLSTTVFLLVPVFTINITEAVMRFTIQDRKQQEYLSIGIIIILKGAIGLTLGLGVLVILPVMEKWKPYYPVILVFFLVNAINSLYQNYLRAVDKVKVMVTGSFINTGVSLGLSIVFLVILRIGISGYFIALILGMVCAIIFMELSSHMFSKVSLHNSKETAIRREMYRYCIPTIFTAVAWWINSGLDHYFVTVMCGVGQNGIYSMAYKIPNILGILQNIFVQSWTLSAIVEFEKDDKDGFFGNTYEMFSSLMLIACSLIMLVNVQLSKVFYAKEFWDAWRYVPLLLVSSLFSALSGYLGSIFAAVKDTKTCAISTISGAALNVILNFSLIPKMSVMGAAVATAITYIFTWMVRLLVSRKYIKMKIKYIKELIAYGLIFIQALCAITDSHMYLIQIIIVIALILMYAHNYIFIVRRILYTGVRG